jgi:magnesium chelatase subunit H
MLPTGRNIHGFDPFGIPSAYAVKDGARQAAKVLERYLETDGACCPKPSPSCCGAPTI